MGSQLQNYGIPHPSLHTTLVFSNFKTWQPSTLFNWKKIKFYQDTVQPKEK